MPNVKKTRRDTLFPRTPPLAAAQANRLPDGRGGAAPNSARTFQQAPPPRQVGRAFENVYYTFDIEAQYAVPFAYKIRWYMKMNLREAVHIGELRTTPQGHPDYRLIVQEMWRKIGEVHPALAGCAKFIDWKTYRLGRLQSEMRTEYKKSAMETEE